MNEKGELSPEELAELERIIPAFKRRGKIGERSRLTKGVKPGGTTIEGGTASKLNPLKPQDREWGEPTKPYTPEDIAKQSNN